MAPAQHTLSLFSQCREGISELRPWQASCLSLPGVMPLEGEQDAAQPDPPPCNLVFSGGPGRWVGVHRLRAAPGHRGLRSGRN